MTWLALAWMALALSLGLVEVVIRIARRRQWLDRPNERSSHQVPTPRLGGLGVLVAASITLGLAAAMGTVPSTDAPRTAVLLGVGAIALLGLLDDLRSLPSAPRMIVQLLVALAVVKGGVRLDLAFLEAPWRDIVSFGASALWLVWLTNLYNFMDGSDGLAASQGIVALLTFCAPFLLHAPDLALILGILAAALAGFLLHNVSPARVFMGDALATSLGFLLGAMGLLSPRLAPEGVSPLFGVLAGSPFVFDATFTLVRRMLRGEPFWRAHRSHVYQTLLVLGWSHRGVHLLYTGLAALSAALALVNPGESRAMWTAAIILLHVGFLAGAIVVRRRKASMETAVATTSSLPERQT